jgi:hypothetical protein
VCIGGVRRGVHRGGAQGVCTGGVHRGCAVCAGGVHRGVRRVCAGVCAGVCTWGVHGRTHRQNAPTGALPTKSLHKIQAGPGLRAQPAYARISQTRADQTDARGSDSRGQNSTERATVLPTRDNAWLLRQNQVPPHHHATIPPLCGLMYMHVWSDVCGLTQRVLGSRRCNVKEHGHYGRQCIKNVSAYKVKAGRTNCGKKHSFTGL